MARKTPDQSIGFRPDISGLRAVAVLAVLLFHMGMKDWRGGFIGVDVFFVISGYLILPRLNLLCAERRFGYVDFMARRIRRLLPAIFPVLLAVSAFGAVFFGDAAFDELLNSVWAASGFVSNVYFALTRGYFERGTELMPLLHTWSLGVEFQFYLLTPVLFVLAGRYRVAALVALTVLSFIISAYQVSQQSTWAYYGLVSRFWQLGFGGLVGIAEPLMQRHLRTALVSVLLRGLGLTVIVATALRYSSEMPFPGVAALLPTLAAGLVIVAPLHDGRDPALWLLRSRASRWIGDRSYSIYLWHWPLLLALHSSGLFARIGDAHRIGAVALTFVLADLSYRYIERPVQTLPVWRSLRRGVVVAFTPVLFASFLLGVQATGGLADLREGLPLRSLRAVHSLADPARRAYLQRLDATGMRGESGLCSVDVLKTSEAAATCLLAADKAETLVIGDSHGRDVLMALRQAFPEQSFHMLHQSGCAPANYKQCFPGLSAALPKLIEAGGYRRVLLISRWDRGSVEGVSPTLEVLKAAQLPVVVIGPGPVFRADIGKMILADITTVADIGASPWVQADFSFDIRATERDLREKVGGYGFGYISRLQVFCPNDRCLGFIAGSADLMFFDTQHLSLEGMAFLADHLRAEAVLRAAFAP